MNLIIAQVDGAGESKGKDKHLPDDGEENLPSSQEPSEELKVSKSLSTF